MLNKDIRNIKNYLSSVIVENINLLDKMCSEINNEYINKHYDLITYNLIEVKQRMSSLEDIVVLLGDKNLLVELQLLKNNYINISNKINRLSNDFRGNILSLLKKICGDDNEVKNDYREDILNKIYNELDLECIMQEDLVCVNCVKNTVGKISFSNISYKQISSYNYCLLHVMNNEISKAVYSLYEFIYNCKLNHNEPFNSYERILIKSMIDLILLQY